MPVLAIGMPGVPELLIILLIVLLLFGAGKLPQVFAAFGKGIKSFRDAQKEGEDFLDVDDTPKKLAEGDVSEAHEVPEKERAQQG